MNYPSFFDIVPPIALQDPLAEILGAFEDGNYEISYIEVVKAAGHSCPTVAGAYLMCVKALEILYPQTTPIRGTVKVEFKEDLQEGVAGVIGNVISHITGATDKSGFKGLQGKFARHSLMHYNANITSSARFTRIDTGVSVEVIYNPSSIKPNPQMMPLMQKLLIGEATAQEKTLFGSYWQERVEKIFQNQDDVLEVITL